MRADDSALQGSRFMSSNLTGAWKRDLTYTPGQAHEMNPPVSREVAEPGGSSHKARQLP
jgi:hypothetical protein